MREASTLRQELNELGAEMSKILPYTESLWPEYRRHFPYTTYGFAMCLFGKLDLFSQYWFSAEANQTRRMVSFLVSQSGLPTKESEIAIQLWRHKLMHTSEPRVLIDEQTQQRYSWLLQHKLDVDHWCFQAAGSTLVLNVGLFNFLEDLRRGLEKAIDELDSQPEVIQSWTEVTDHLGQFNAKY